MKPLTLILVVGMMPGIIHAQSASINATISFQNPSPSCSISGADDLHFGSLEFPGTGTVSVTVNAETGAVTTVPASYSYRVTGASVGDFQLSGSHVNSYTIRMSSAALPTALTSESRASDTIPYSAVARRSTNGSTWGPTSTLGPGAFDSGSGGGVFSSFTRYYRLGGTISGIARTTPDAKYSATITLSLSCS